VKLEDFMNVFFGEMALIDDDVRSASVLADTDCECFVIKKSDFQKLADENHMIGYFVTQEIAKILSSRLRKAGEDTITLFEALVSEIGDLG
ncbi:MAG: cyclic nucleotide-binding domain-containing protein, partial [bacterium]